MLCSASYRVFSWVTWGSFFVTMDHLEHEFISRFCVPKNFWHNAVSNFPQFIITAFWTATYWLAYWLNIWLINIKKVNFNFWCKDIAIDGDKWKHWWILVELWSYEPTWYVFLSSSCKVPNMLNWTISGYKKKF